MARYEINEAFQMQASLQGLLDKRPITRKSASTSSTATRRAARNFTGRRDLQVLMGGTALLLLAALACPPLRWRCCATSWAPKQRSAPAQHSWSWGLIALTAVLGWPGAGAWGDIGRFARGDERGGEVDRARRSPRRLSPSPGQGGGVQPPR